MSAIKREIKYTVQKIRMPTEKQRLFRVPSTNIKKSRSIPVRESLSWFSGKMEKELQAFDRNMYAWETEFALAILDDLDEQVIRTPFPDSYGHGEHAAKNSECRH